LYLKIKFIFTWFLVSVLLITSFVLFVPEATADPTLPSMEPRKGVVGTTVHVRGRIDTAGGEYSILFNGQPVKNGTASDKSVEDYFVVPPVPRGNYSVTLYDVTANSESVPLNFTVVSSFNVWTTTKPYPAQIQEGEIVEIWTNVSGGKANWAYFLNVTVIDPAKSVYWAPLTLRTDEKGLGNASLMYPSDLILPVKANTNYTGDYQITVNGTVATGSFFIGITNSSEYHRFETVEVKALGYRPGDNATIKIEFPDGRSPLLGEVQVQEDGIVQYLWEVPEDAPLGEYVLSISQAGWEKKVEDVQKFSLPGFPVKIKALNLNGEPVPSVDIKVYELCDDSRYEVPGGKTGDDGVAEFPLEIGNYSCEAFLRERFVGEKRIQVVGEGAWDLTCDLINIKIVVRDWKTLEPLPLVKLEVTYSYLVGNKTKTYTSVEETDINGTAVFHSMFKNVSYVIDASRYGKTFNKTSVEKLLAQKFFNLTITCPPRNLEVQVSDSKLAPLPSATVKVYELAFGYQVGESKTDSSGKTAFKLTFGKYKLKVFVDDVLLNETEVDLTLQNETLLFLMNCQLYNVNFQVKVLDFFGNPIPNAKVEVTKERSSYTWESITAADGTASFQEIIGGDCQVSVYLEDNTLPSLTQQVYIRQSGTVTLKVDRYVSFAGRPMEMMVFSTLIILAAIALPALIFSAYLLLKKRVKK